MVKIMNEKLVDIIKSVLIKFNEPYIDHKLIKTNGNIVLLLNKKYIVKIANRNLLLCEKIFFDYYKGKIYEKLIFNNYEKKYNVYEYINGKPMQNIYDVDGCLDKIIEHVKTYVKYKKNIYGNILNKNDTWKDFLLYKINQSCKYLNDYDIYINDLNKANAILSTYKFNPRLIHGDLGCYNILVHNKNIVGIIDPIALVGDPLYDIIYFICSHTKIIENINLNEIIYKINEPKEKIISMMKIISFIRISIDSKHGGKNKKIYKDLWDKLKMY